MESNKPDSKLPTQQPSPQPLPQPQPLTSTSTIAPTPTPTPTPPQLQPASQTQPQPQSQPLTTTQPQPQQQQPLAVPQIQHQPQQVQVQIQQAQQLIQPQLAPQLQSPQQTQQLAPSSQATVVSAAGPIAQLAPPQQQATIQPACSVAPSPSVVPQLGQGPRGPANRIRPLCCLMDNDVRCDREAGNASFNARIQKIVGTKKMNFTLDPTARHTYICDHHKGIITVAKKSATIARDTKANARNLTANSNANNLVLHPHPSLDYEFTLRQQQQQQQQQTLQQHSGTLDLSNNQNRLVANHTSALNNMPIRHGAHLAYGHFQSSHPNQVGFDNSGGGDNVASSGGGSGGAGGGGSGIDVDLQQLQVSTLRRYKKHFRVPTRPGLNKMQLAESLKGHFRTLPIIEKEAITYFVYIVKCYRNKLDHNPKAD